MTFISTHNPQERTVLSDYYVYRAVYHLGHATPRAPIQGTDITRAEDEFVILRVDELQRFGLYCQRPDGPDSLYLLRPSARAVAELEQSIASANLVSSSGSTLVLVNS